MMLESKREIANILMTGYIEGDECIVYSYRAKGSSKNLFAVFPYPQQPDLEANDYVQDVFSFIQTY